MNLRKDTVPIIFVPFKNIFVIYYDRQIIFKKILAFSLALARFI